MVFERSHLQVRAAAQGRDLRGRTHRKPVILRADPWPRGGLRPTTVKATRSTVTKVGVRDRVGAEER